MPFGRIEPAIIRSVILRLLFEPAKVWAFNLTGDAYCERHKDPPNKQSTERLITCNVVDQTIIQTEGIGSSLTVQSTLSTRSR